MTCTRSGHIRVRWPFVKVEFGLVYKVMKSGHGNMEWMG